MKTTTITIMEQHPMPSYIGGNASYNSDWSQPRFNETDGGC